MREGCDTLYIYYRKMFGFEAPRSARSSFWSKGGNESTPLGSENGCWEVGFFEHNSIEEPMDGY